jgi:FKBP-type peptidyl-prolyl cis-trans isomerase
MYPEVFASLGFRQTASDDEDDEPVTLYSTAPQTQAPKPQKVMSRKERRQERKDLKSEARAQKRRMKEQANTAGKKSLAMGVIVRDIVEGRLGDPAKPGDTAVVKYHAKLKDGTFFASSKGW